MYIHIFLQSCFQQVLQFTKNILGSKHFFTFSDLVTSVSYGPFYSISSTRLLTLFLHSVSLREISRVSPGLPRALNMAPDYLSYFFLFFIFEVMRVWEQKIARVLWSALSLFRNKKTKKGRISEPNTSCTIVHVPFLELVQWINQQSLFPGLIILKI